VTSVFLVDTSAWTQTLRRNGDAAVRLRVEAMIAANQAAWCDPVRLELWNGVRGATERARLRQLEQSLVVLPITGAVWDSACSLAERARTGGLNVPAVDIVVFACAREYGVGLEHRDKHFALLSTLK
jgi:predicted nucleic acid-binding protein